MLNFTPVCSDDCDDSYPSPGWCTECGIWASPNEFRQNLLSITNYWWASGHWYRCEDNEWKTWLILIVYFSVKGKCLHCSSAFIQTNSMGNRKLCYAVPWTKSLVGAEMRCGKCRKHFMSHDSKYINTLTIFEQIKCKFLSGKGYVTHISIISMLHSGMTDCSSSWALHGKWSKRALFSHEGSTHWTVGQGKYIMHIFVNSVHIFKLPIVCT